MSDRELGSTTEALPAPLWRMAFRPFFLAAASTACLAIPLWIVHLWTGVALGGVSLDWHIHEMLMGFAATTILGFVLTAAQTWTGIRSVHGGSLQFMFALWLTARVCWLFSSDLQWLGALADSLLYVSAALVMARMVVRARNWRNGFFVLVFLGFAFFSAAHFYALLQANFTAARALQDFAFYLIVHVVLVVGGRVIPFFSDRRLQRPATVRWQWLELGALLSSLLFMAVVTYSRSSTALQICAALVAGFNLLRWLSWKPWQTSAVPLLWSLYIAYAFIIAGFAAIAANLSFSAAIHLIAVGGIGLMILAMTSRVSLGHSGRPLELPNGYTLAFWALISAALSRALASLLPEYYFLLLWIAAASWTLGFLVFLRHYLPMLISPRPDGGAG